MPSVSSDLEAPTGAGTLVGVDIRRWSREWGVADGLVDAGFAFLGISFGAAIEYARECICLKPG